MSRSQSRLKSERGAILVFTAIAIVVLMGFLTFVVDNGIRWVSRAEAQNAADAGALAGAIARAFDDTGSSPVLAPGGKAYDSAMKTAKANFVWRQAPDAVVTWDCPGWIGVTGTCVRVDVFRGAPGRGPGGTMRGVPLPLFFGPVLKIPHHGVRATATAQAAAANGTNCLKPWAVADKWLERDAPPWTQQSTFEPGNPVTDDVYIAPYSPLTTGFKRANADGTPVDTGYQLTLKMAHPGPGSLSSGWAMELYLPNDAAPGEGANNYLGNIVGCTSATIGLAKELEACAEVNTEHGCLDVSTAGGTGKTSEGVETIVARDSAAVWSGGLGGHISGGDGLNERVVPVALFDTALYLSQGYNGTNGIVKLVGLLGFFLEGLCKDASPNPGSGEFLKEPYLDCANNENDVVGRLVSFPGTWVAGAGQSTEGAGFGQVIRLIR